MDKDAFRNYLGSLTYDKMYQDIEYIDMIGYSSSFKTWESIKDLVKWKGKIVADLGCFHGYFAFKIAELGGKVTGLDRSPEVLDTAKLLNDLYKSSVEFKQWVGGEPVSEEFDIALCLNMLHHTGDEEKTLQNLNCKTVIFEVKYDQRFLISQYFNTIKSVPSHRVGRIILLGEKIDG